MYFRRTQRRLERYVSQDPRLAALINMDQPSRNLREALYAAFSPINRTMTNSSHSLLRTMVAEFIVMTYLPALVGLPPPPNDNS